VASYWLTIKKATLLRLELSLHVGIMMKMSQMTLERSGVIWHRPEGGHGLQVVGFPAPLATLSTAV
jgi:hypothetical protein